MMDPRIARAAARIRASQAVARRQARDLILADDLDDDEVVEVAALFGDWTTRDFAVDDIVNHDGVLYRCVQAHTGQDGWEPPNVPALWTPVRNITDNPDPWVQPTGSHDAYPLDALVTHNGQTWRSTHAANVWEPPTQWELA